MTPKKTTETFVPENEPEFFYVNIGMTRFDSRKLVNGAWSSSFSVKLTPDQFETLMKTFSNFKLGLAAA